MYRLYFPRTSVACKLIMVSCVCLGDCLAPHMMHIRLTWRFWCRPTCQNPLSYWGVHVYATLELFITAAFMPIGACCRRTWHGWNCFVMTCTGCGSRLALLPVLLIRRFISYSGKTSLCTTMSSGRSSLEGASSMHASKGRRSSTPLNCICGSGISCIRRSGLTRSPHRTSEHMPWRLIEVLVACSVG